MEMVAEIKIWILIAAAGVMATVMGFIIKVVTAQVLKRLDEIVTELKQLTNITTVQKEQIKHLQEQDTVIRRRLQNHAARINALELNAIKS